MPKIPQHFIDDLLARTDIVDLIDHKLQLKRQGANFAARCPFHDEKSASFTVSRTKQFYHCFGCGAHGNAIGWLMNYDRMDFLEAVEWLADSHGLPVPREAHQQPRRPGEPPAEQIYHALDAAAKYYRTALRDSPGVAYLKSRGLSAETAQRYRLGYAPPGWRNLPKEFAALALVAAGLAVDPEEGRAYCRFRDRIMFPIRDRRGRVVGFGGRVVGDGEPKYLNSPETPVFRKGAQVYGLFEALQANPKPPFLLVVEGNIDAVMLSQHGYPNTVATCGTAVTPEQVALMFRHTQELVFALDGDAAGRKAAWRALEACLPELRDGRRVRFLSIPEGHDPDSYIRAEPEGFAARLAAAMPLSECLFSTVAQECGGDGTLEGRAAMAAKVRPLIGRVPPGDFRDLLEARLRELLGRRIDAPRSPRLCPA